jgi:hypothetical protein
MRWKTRGEAEKDGLTAAESGTRRDWMSLRDREGKGREGKERREEARTRAVEVEAAGEPPAADVPRLLLPRGEGIPSAECGVGVSAVGFACSVFSIATYSVLSNRQRNKLMQFGF